MPLVGVGVGENVGLEVKVTVGVKVGVQEAQGVFVEVKVTVGAGGLEGADGLELPLQAIGNKDKAAKTISAPIETFIENPFTQRQGYPVAKFGRGRNERKYIELNEWSQNLWLFKRFQKRENRRRKSIIKKLNLFLLKDWTETTCPQYFLS